MGRPAVRASRRAAAGGRPGVQRIEQVSASVLCLLPVRFFELCAVLALPYNTPRTNLYRTRLHSTVNTWLDHSTHAHTPDRSLNREDVRMRKDREETSACEREDVRMRPPPAGAVAPRQRECTTGAHASGGGMGGGGSEKATPLGGSVGVEPPTPPPGATSPRGERRRDSPECCSPE